MWFFRRRGASQITQERSNPLRRVFGRTYLRGSPYLLPKDLGEVNRLDLQHYMLRYALHGNYAAQIASPRAILDVGCGTGRWAREVAAYFPDANVIGTDLVAPPADTVSEVGVVELRPANYSFVVSNVLEGLPFPDHSFDYVHMRLLYLALPEHSWPQVMRELVRVTRPGGWVESVEGDLAQDGGPALATIFGWFSQMSARRGIDLTVCRRVGELMREAGLRNVTTRDIAIPIGAYGGRLGAMAASNFLAGLDGIRALIVNQGLATAEEYDRAAKTLRETLPQYKCVQPFHIAVGQAV